MLSPPFAKVTAAPRPNRLGHGVVVLVVPFPPGPPRCTQAERKRRQPKLRQHRLRKQPRSQRPGNRDSHDSDPAGVLTGHHPQRPTPPRPAACRRTEEHTSELQSPVHLVCRLLLEKKKKQTK